MSEQENVPGEGSGSGKPVAHKKRRGWWWKIPLVLLVLLVILLLLAPTIASTSPVREFALSKINANMPGKLAVADWSLGWFSGTKAKGISYTDDRGHKLVDVSAVTTPVTLMQLVGGNLHAGEIVIPEATVDAVVPAAEQPNEPKKPGTSTEKQEPAPPPPNFTLPCTASDRLRTAPNRVH